MLQPSSSVGRVTTSFGTSSSGLNPSMVAADGSIRDSVGVSGPFGDARATYRRVDGNMLSYDFTAGEGSAPNSPERKAQFDVMLLRLMRLDNVPASRVAEVADQLCEQNRSLRDARSAFMGASGGTTVAANLPPTPTFA